MRATLFAALLGLSACGGGQYVYQPETANAVLPSGIAASRTAIPQEQPQGSVEVASYGITQLTTDGQRIPVIHARLVVSNDGDDSAWHLDARRQIAEIPGAGRSAPIYANADVRTMPDVTIRRHERHIVDLYYPLPDAEASAEHLPAFTLQWEVSTPARTVASSTAFDRVGVDPEPAYAYDAAWPMYAGYGPYWWYDPFYPQVVFVGASRYPIHHRHGAVAVGRFGGRFSAGGARVGHAAPVHAPHGAGHHR